MGKNMRSTTTEKWRSWLHAILEDIGEAINGRRIWRELTAAWGFNRALDIQNELLDWISAGHAATAALAVRRQLDRGDDVVSLWRLLTDLSAHAQFWTVDEHLAQVPDAEDHPWLRELAPLWCAPGTAHLDPAVPTADLARLEQAGEIARHYADRKVAHADRRGLEHHVTFGTIHEALDAVEGVALRYYTILTCSAYIDNSLLTHRQFDHETILRRAWKRPRWRKRPWPAGLVEREGELNPSLDVLSRQDYANLIRHRRELVKRLSEAWRWDKPGASPIRVVLGALQLPTSDAAVQWVRDYLVLQGDTWSGPHKPEQP